MYEMKPLECDPARLSGLSEKLIVSHYENNYGGCRQAAQPDHRLSGQRGLGESARVLNQRTQARGTDRDEIR
jgi:hypothetical protein